MPRDRTAQLPLVALSFGMFALGTTSLVVLGLAAAITAEFNTPPGAAGGLVTAFALTYALAAPLLQWIFSGRLGLRAQILIGLVLLGAGSIWGATVGSFEELLAARSLSALGGALLAPSSAAAGVAIVSLARRGRALATIYAGFTLASVIGVPLATWLGLALGWRGATACIGAFALASAATVAATLRDVPAAKSPLSVSTLTSMSLDPRVATALGTTVLHLSAQFAIYAPMSILLVQRFGLEPTALPAALVLFGIGGVTGNALAGRLADRFTPSAPVKISFIGLAVCFTILCFDLHPWIAVGILTCCATFGTLFSAPQQARLAARVPAESHAAVLALNSSAGYLGLALGSTAAGIAAVYGDAGPPAAAIGLLAIAGMLFLASLRNDRTASRDAGVELDSER